MFNVGGGELLVIFLVALIVLGPAKLPEVARQLGGFAREIKRISSHFQDEMRAAMDDPVESAARERGNRVVATSEKPAPAAAPDDEAVDADGSDDAAANATGGDEDEAGTGERPPMSTAAAAGMYDVAPPSKPSTPNPYRAPVGTRAQPPDDGDDTEPSDDTERSDDTDTEAVAEPDDGDADRLGRADAAERVTDER